MQILECTPKLYKQWLIFLTQEPNNTYTENIKDNEINLII